MIRISSKKFFSQWLKIAGHKAISQIFTLPNYIQTIGTLDSRINVETRISSRYVRVYLTYTLELPDQYLKKYHRLESYHVKSPISFSLTQKNRYGIGKVF